MYCVFVKHYLDNAGIIFFNEKWFPMVQKAISVQPGFVGVTFEIDTQNKQLVHIVVSFKSEATLLAWAKTEAHDLLVDGLDIYRTRSWEWAAIDTGGMERQVIHRNSELLTWHETMPKNSKTDAKNADTTTTHGQQQF